MRHNVHRLFIFATAAIIAVTAPLEVRAATPQNPPINSDKPKPVLIEEYYRENDITFFGRDFSACDASGSGGPANINVDKGFSLGKDPKERRVNLVKAFMKDLGLTAAQGAGIVGNFMRESGGEDIPPDINEGGKKGPPAFSGGYGWAQWTGGRQTAFIDFAVKKGYMKSRSVNANDAANYAWLKWELANTEKATIPALKKQKTPEDAAVSFEATFERAGVPALGERSQGARQVLNEYNGARGGSGPAGSSGGVSSDGCSADGSSIVGDNAFPLKTTKKEVDRLNPGMFKNNTAGKGGHPYTAFDILADGGTEIVAFLPGTVTMTTTDVCGGGMVSVYNKASNLTISYLHMNDDHIKEGKKIELGDKVGTVGASAGCSVPHLHIDAAKGDSRPGCSRGNCPQANASKFVDIGPELFKTYEALP